METEEGPGNYYGYEIDLLSEIQHVAEQDGYHLTFDMELSPQRYTDAFDLVANDCNTTINPNPLEECQRFDLIVGDYFRTADRSVRVDLSPTILHTAISSINTIKDADQKKYDVPTLTQLQAQGGTACIPAGTSTRAKVMGRFQDINYLDCPNPGECLNWLKEGKCSLYASSEVLLEYNALVDPQLEVTGEQFYPQVSLYCVYTLNFIVYHIYFIMCMCICLFIHLHCILFILKNMQLTFNLRSISVHRLARYLQSRCSNVTSSEKMDVRCLH